MSGKTITVSGHPHSPPLLSLSLPSISLSLAVSHCVPLIAYNSTKLYEVIDMDSTLRDCVMFLNHLEEW